MKNKLFIGAWLLTGLARSAFSQGGIYGYPFEVPRSFAMGESFVALSSNPAALMYNPAGLAGLSGIRVSYSQRTLDADNNWTLRSFNAVAGTPFGVFGVQYNRDSYGTFPLTMTGGEQPVVDTYDYDIAMGYAVGLGRGFSVGVAAKYYDYEGNASTFPSSPARLFDIGFTYTFRRFHSQTTVEDSITIGMSYQNIGSAWSKQYTGIHIPELDLPHWFPQYFRAGLSYALRVLPRNEADPSPLEAALSGEFRSLQTDPYPSSGISEWGLGLECTIEEFLSLRAGTTSIDGINERWLFRWGGAVRLPVHKLGFDLLLQYGRIPEYSFSAFSIDLQYYGWPY
jgi:hypothetical protein